MIFCCPKKNIVTKQKKGFTLVEMLVAVSLFSVVAIISTGTVLVLINNNTSRQSDQQTLGALTMAFDTMTREIRTGTYYRCANSNFANLASLPSVGNSDCISGARGIAFRESTRRLTLGRTNDLIAFYYDSTARTIFRKISDLPPESIIPDNIEITSFRFVVLGTPTLLGGSGNVQQPFVLIVVEARERNTNEPPVLIQTTVTQRILDL
jgi:prepilin-type N-terminal cleavage/methylation domain-containing protein